ncbi:MAG: Rab family GTPase [Hyphomicrobiales bacterium]
MTIAQKIMILGDIGVGKTSIANRFVFDRFDADYKATIGVDIYTHDCTYDWEGKQETIRFVLWDTDGDFGLSIFSTIYLKGAAGALIVADVTRPNSMAKMAELVAQFAEAKPGRPTAAILNKIDLVENGPLEEPEFAVRPDVLVRTSARTGEGIAEAFQDIAIAIRRRSI